MVESHLIPTIFLLDIQRHIIDKFIKMYQCYLVTGPRLLFNVPQIQQFQPFQMDVVTLVNRVPIVFENVSDDDYSDRLNYRYTSALLVMFSAIILTRQFGPAENIVCWLPAHFTSYYEQYAQQVCWVSNTYYLDHNQQIPKPGIERKKTEIKYYQWIVIVLLFQSFFFYLPHVLWKTASSRSGLNISDLIQAANNYKSISMLEDRAKYMEYLYSSISKYADKINVSRTKKSDEKSTLRKKCLSCLPKLLIGNYLVLLYFLVKLLFICNILIQILILSAIIGKNFFKFGFDFLYSLSNGNGWPVESKYFPRVAMCDFSIREIGNPNKSHIYTVQCALPINFFNQQIFTFVWFWYFLVLICNLFGLMKWASRCLPSKRSLWIERRLRLIDKTVSKNKNRVWHFIKVYLEADGIFMIRIIACNISDFVATELLHHLWKRHYEKYREQVEDDVEQGEYPHNTDTIERATSIVSRSKFVLKRETSI